jgi:hypothetical protein
MVCHISFDSKTLDRFSLRPFKTADLDEFLGQKSMYISEVVNAGCAFEQISRNRVLDRNV